MRTHESDNNKRFIGYWRSDREPWLPMPEGCGFHWKTREGFLARLAYIESTLAKETLYRGMSRCRVCGCMNGSREYWWRGFTWPQGYHHYVEDHYVAPPLDFYEAVIEIPLSISKGKSK